MRRHPVLLTLALLLLAAAGLLAWFVASFDLNRYRSELQQTLSHELGRPVRLGQIHLSLRHGPALDVRDVAVGRPGQDLTLSIRHLFLRLDLRELLQRRLQTRNLLLDHPVLTLTLMAGSTPAATSGPPRFDPHLLEQLGFSDCTLRAGRVEVLTQRSGKPRPVLAVERLDGHLSNLAAGQSGHLQLTGQLHLDGHRTGFELKGDLTAGTAFPFWHQARYDLQLSLKHLAAAWLTLLTPPFPAGWSLDGALAIQAHFVGQPASGVAITLTADTGGLELTTPNGPAPAPPLQRIELSTRWTEEQAATRFTPLALSFDGHRLQGDLSLDRAPDGTTLNGELAASELPLPAWDRLFPAGPDPLLGLLREHLAGGQLHQLQLALKLPLGGRQVAPADAFNLAAELVGLRLFLPQTGPFENVGGRLQLTPATLTVEGGRAELAGNVLRFAGTLAAAGNGAPQLSAQAEGELGAGWLGARFGKRLPAALELAGTLPVRVTLSGSMTQPRVDLRADLQPLQVRYGQLLSKPAGDPAELFLSGELASAALTLNYGRLRWQPLELMADGRFDLTPVGTFALNLRLPPLDLKALAKQVPLLQRWRPVGQVSGEYHLRGNRKRLGPMAGSFNLNGIGLHLGHIVADLADLGGTLRSEGRQLDFKGLTGRLGQSPFTASGHFSDLTAPAGRVDVRARSLRADEVIFHSDTAYLRDLDAHLVVAPDRLEFAPARVRLDGGTRAEVRGTVSHFEGPVAVDLDISADYGDIDEVIGLWHRSDQAPPLSVPVHHGPPPHLLIHARAARGQIGGMDFQDAKGDISLVDHTLVIHPLTCRIGPGFATGQVLVDHAEEGPPLLRISGHAEDIAAEVVHQQLLKQSSLVKGRLRGDFYIQGRAGSPFLATSMGGFSIEIKDGVLRKFKSLSKVFSLLNVSQILTLKLPDMDREGMPFEKLTGTFRLDQGVLSSEDLFVESPAMNLSLIGKLNLSDHRIDAVMGVKPLRTVDKIITNIPLAGWLLTGNEKALITAQFTIKGPTADPEVVPIPISTLSHKVLGIFRRVLGLPGKVVDDVGSLLQGGKK